MKILTSELTGHALDWAVAKCRDTPVTYHNDGITCGVMRLRPDGQNYDGLYSPSTDWAQGGPIIDREMIQLTPHCMVNPLHGWAAAFRSFDEDDNVFALHRMRGRAPLTAAMRCYVTSKLGDTVDIPEELL